MNLRLLALGGVVACAVALPLAMASAGPAGEDGRPSDRADVHAADRRSPGAAGEQAAGTIGERPADAADRRAGAAGGRGGAGAAGDAPGTQRTEGAEAAEGHRGTDGNAGRGADGADPKAPSAAPSRPLVLGLGLATAARCGPELTSPEGVEAQTCVLSRGEDTWARTYYRNATGRALDAVLSLMGPAGRTVQTRCPVAAEDEPDSCETPHEPSRGTPAAYTAVTEFAEVTQDGPLLLHSGSNFPSDTGS
ncbi:hypothetical protein P1S61_07745 [Streptomyces sp. ME08-AFT2]|uniref:hypothetical protein n=1 Tax=Streptomyces sp. ME08-AFT2 TaxID=3028683 RepID=UPI0029BCBEEE|nr:hypothetical protein [Streptomyces sp. ME08-AFT2]MDX3308991.1 hypothetical protein [Streptomyces sp. ME08-AFT2]